MSDPKLEQAIKTLGGLLESDTWADDQGTFPIRTGLLRAVLAALAEKNICYACDKNSAGICRECVKQIREEYEAKLAEAEEALAGAWNRMDRARSILHSETAEWAMLDTKLDRAALAAAQDNLSDQIERTR